MPFSDICMLTSVEEGTVVRAITRVDETCREVCLRGTCGGIVQPRPHLCRCYRFAMPHASSEIRHCIVKWKWYVVFIATNPIGDHRAMT